MNTKIFASVVATMAILVTGCSQSKSGGPGATPAKPPLSQSLPTTQSKETFSIDVPNMATKLKKGETKEVALSLKRGKEMNQDVTLSFSGAPSGVSVEPASVTISGTDTEAKVMVKTTDAAPVGDFMVKVTGHPQTGADATNEFKVSVSDK